MSMFWGSHRVVGWIAALLLVAGCEKAVYYGQPPPEPGDEPAEESLLLVSLVPGHGATEVPEDVTVEARFSLPPDPASVTTATFRLFDVSANRQVASGVEAVVEEPGASPTLFRLTPAAPLRVSQRSYRIEFAPGIITDDGLPLDLDASAVVTPARFTTRGPPDTLPPHFFYYNVHARAISATAIELSWFPALDEAGTPMYMLYYAIYMGEVPDAINFTQPVAVTDPLETSRTIGGLSPSTTYYFVVHPIDEVGNEDPNPYVVSERTFLAEESTDVTILYSADVFGILEPCG